MKQNIPVSVCGQTAEDLTMIPFLVGLGVNELSMSPGAMPLVKKLIRTMSMAECVELVSSAFECDNSVEVIEMSQKLIRKLVPELTMV